jgi:hypothetical protein
MLGVVTTSRGGVRVAVTDDEEEDKLLARG